MEISKKKMNQAPEKGKILAYFREGVVYGTYDRKGNIVTNQDLDSHNHNLSSLLELHLFDKEKEYRWIQSSVRGEIEKVFSLEEEKTDQDYFYYEEEMLLDLEDDTSEKEARLKVRSCYSFNKRDMLEIKNYRLIG